NISAGQQKCPRQTAAPVEGDSRIGYASRLTEQSGSSMAVARASPALIGAAFFVISACTSDSAAVADTTAGAETGAVSSRSGSEWVAVADLGSSSSPVVSDAPLQTKLALWMELMQPKPAVRFDEAAAFVQENPDWPAQTVLRRRVEELMPEFLPAELMLDWFAARPPVSSVGKLRHAEALLR